jgi:malonyl-CoA O-methyltransferase
MISDRKQRIEKSFGSRAQSYHQHATLQRHIAQKLVSFLPEKALSKILEIGCGTGFVTELLLHKYPQSQIHVTDISRDMLHYTQQRFIGYKNLTFSVQDGENLNVDQKYDLVISSMAVQWFENPNATLNGYKNILTSDGTVYFSTLGNKSFQEWRHCLNELNLSSGLLYQHQYDAIFEEDKTLMTYKSGLEFLKDFKIIGAHQSRENHQPLKQSELKKACALLEEKYDASVTWHIQYGRIFND